MKATLTYVFNEDEAPLARRCANWENMTMVIKSLTEMYCRGREEGLTLEDFGKVLEEVMNMYDIPEAYSIKLLHEDLATKEN